MSTITITITNGKSSLALKEGEVDLVFKIKNNEVVFQTGMFDGRKYLSVEEFFQIVQKSSMYRCCNGIYIMQEKKKTVDCEIYPA